MVLGTPYSWMKHSLQLPTPLPWKLYALNFLLIALTCHVSCVIPMPSPPDFYTTSHLHPVTWCLGTSPYTANTWQVSPTSAVEILESIRGCMTQTACSEMKPSVKPQETYTKEVVSSRHLGFPRKGSRQAQIHTGFRWVFYPLQNCGNGKDANMTVGNIISTNPVCWEHNSVSNLH